MIFIKHTWNNYLTLFLKNIVYPTTKGSISKLIYIYVCYSPFDEITSSKMTRDKIHMYILVEVNFLVFKVFKCTNCHRSEVAQIKSKVVPVSRIVEYSPSFDNNFLKI